MEEKKKGSHPLVSSVCSIVVLESRYRDSGQDVDRRDTCWRFRILLWLSFVEDGLCVNLCVCVCVCRNESVFRNGVGQTGHGY